MSPRPPTERPHRAGTLRLAGFGRIAGTGRLAALGLLAALAFAGCASSSTEEGSAGQPATDRAASAVATDTTGGAMRHGTTEAAADGCRSHMPGEILDAADAVVSFSNERVCLGYVTIAPGTPVGWRNTGDRPATVTVSAEDPLEAHTVPPGGTWTRPFGDPGVYTYRVDVLPAFVGTVEVVGASR